MLRKTLLFLSLAALGLAGCNAHTASPSPPKEKATTSAPGEMVLACPIFPLTICKDARFLPLTFAAK